MQQLGFGKILLLLVMLLGSSAVALTCAQLGEVAGGQNFNVSLGGTATSNTFTIVNAGSSPIGFVVKLPQFNTIPNSTTPNVTIYPMNGTLAPHSDFKLNITVYMPLDHNKPGDRWDGLIQVLQTLPAGSGTGGGAVIETGVGKEIIIVATAEVYNWPLIGIGVAIVMVAAYLLYTRFLSKGKGKAKGRRTGSSVSSLLKAKTAKRKRRRKTAKRQPGRKPARKRARKKRRR